MTLERGYLLNKRYRIVEILGQGGMAAVYRAIDENLGVEVAVKENLFTTEEYARQFRLEAVILANLRHPNMPRVTDHFVIDQQGQYLVMDYIEGEDLRQRMDRLGPLPEDEVIILGAAICDALSYLHSRKPPVLHRDIKPGNVKITPYGQIFLVDFGLAKVVQGSQVTTTGARAMTPGYSPPEQYGTAHTDSRTDIYSLAATLYSALTDALPEDGLARAMDQADLTPIRKHNPKVTRKLASVIEKGLEVKPDNRYQTGEEFRDDLMNSKNTTRQRSDLNITPPPPVSEMVKSNGGSNGGEKTPVAESEVVEAKGNGVSIVSLPSSGPLVEGGYAPVSRPRRQKRPSMWLFIFFLLIIAVGSVGATYLYPSWPAMALAMFQPSATSTPTTEAPPPTSTAGPADTATFAPSPMPTQEVVVIEPTATASDTATATPRPTRTPTPNYTPTISPTPIGSGFGQLAIASDRSGVPEIWLVDLVGDNLTMLTNFPEGACQPSWSPDGKRLVFISPCPKNQLTYAGASMFILDIDAGTAPQPLATLPGGDFDPSWSPDGKFIAFTSLRDRRPQIYLYELATNTVIPLTDPFDRDNQQPAWSPDGQKLVYVQSGSTLWFMDRDGKNRRRLTYGTSDDCLQPTWSPDGNTIIFSQRQPGQVGSAWLSIVKFNPSGDQIPLPVLQDSNWPMAEPNFSPDGFWLVFRSWPDGAHHHIFYMTANGVGRQQITEGDYIDFDPVWRPAVE